MMGICVYSESQGGLWVLEASWTATTLAKVSRYAIPGHALKLAKQQQRLALLNIIMHTQGLKTWDFLKVSGTQ